MFNYAYLSVLPLVNIFHLTFGLFSFKSFSVQGNVNISRRKYLQKTEKNVPVARCAEAKLKWQNIYTEAD